MVLARFMQKMKFSSKSGKNVFAEATALANKYNSVNLGQGFPSFPMDDFVKDLAIESIKDNKNQYVRPGGSLPLVNSLADLYTDILKYKINPLTNICVYAGAQQGIFVVLSELCQRGDEVICIEPAFDSYRKSAEYLGLVYKPLVMDSNLNVSIDTIREAISDKTSLLLLNTPHNPTGKVYSKKELTDIINLLEEYPNLHILSDEVYEFLVFDGYEHHYLLSLAPEKLRNRIVSLSSAGKSFSCTGWRIGYSIADESITKKLLNAQTVMTFCNVTPMEEAFAKSFQLVKENGAFERLAGRLQANRDKLKNVLESIPTVSVINPHGGYFITGDFTEIAKSKIDHDPTERIDYEFNEWLTKEIGITGIPLSAFFSNPVNDGTCKIRLAFCKTDEELDEAAKRLQKLV